jgi:hypothetical protein
MQILRRIDFILIAVLLLPLAGGGCQVLRPDRQQSAARAARDLDNPELPDVRRRAINWLADRRAGRREPFLSHFRQMAVGIPAEQVPADPSHLVRATAVRALNRARDAQSIPVFLQALNDPHDMVRLEGAKALANVPSAQAVSPLIQRLMDLEEHQDVRIAAADALRHYPRPDVGRALLAVLNERQFGIAYRARMSLVYLTGEDFRYNEAAWRRHLTETERPFGVSPDPRQQFSVRTK